MKKITIFGAGAVGTALAVHLSTVGKDVTLVRARQAGEKPVRHVLTLSSGTHTLRSEIECLSRDQVRRPEGLLVITTKSFANPMLADALARAEASGPICVLQNGLGVEQPFLEKGFPEIYRGILYVTGEKISESHTSLNVIQPALLGAVIGSAAEACACELTTPAFPFEASEGIEREVWKKTIVNSVFNSICPLLDVDNGVFSRSSAGRKLAREVIRECVSVAQRLEINLREDDIFEQVLRISTGSRHLISTLQDLRSHRPTEIQSLNLAISAFADGLNPPVPVPRTRLLGELILLRSIGEASNG